MTTESIPTPIPMPVQEPLPAVSVCVVRDGKVLLVKRGRPPVMGLYAFPGGRVDPGESDEAAARRELHEETGLDATSVRFIEEVITEPEPSTAMPGFRLRVFSAVAPKGDPVAADDAAEAAFFTLPEMESLPLVPDVLRIASDEVAGLR